MRNYHPDLSSELAVEQLRHHHETLTQRSFSPVHFLQTTRGSPVRLYPGLLGLLGSSWVDYLMYSKYKVISKSPDFLPAAQERHQRSLRDLRYLLSDGLSILTPKLDRCGLNAGFAANESLALRLSTASVDGLEKHFLQHPYMLGLCVPTYKANICPTPCSPRWPRIERARLTM